MKDTYGTFGNLAYDYQKYRSGYPMEVFEFIQSRIGGDKINNVLDIGCGTGISTSQLSDYFGNGVKVWACDKDVRMIAVAKKYLPTVSFQVAQAERLPYEDKKFDLITAFSAFHWFNNVPALAEIRRVLNRDGHFVVCNKLGTGRFKDYFRNFVAGFLGKELPNIYEGYDPANFLANSGFGVEEKIISYGESLSLEEGIGLYKTMSIYNLVPEDAKLLFIDELKSKLEQDFPLGILKRTLDIKVVLAKLVS